MNKHTEIVDENKKIDYFEALIDSFEQIDVNGDETMEWDEFSNYIVETGIAKQKKNFIDVIRNYHINTSISKITHDSEIIKCLFVPKLKNLFVLESRSKKIKIINFDSNSNLSTKKTRIIEAAHQSSVINIEHIPSINVIVTSGSDNVLKFWSLNKDFELINKLPTREVQLIIKWSDKSKLLITGGFDCVLNVYKNIEFEENGNFKNSVNLVSMKRIHKDSISDILIIDKLGLIASSCFIGIINLWSLKYLEWKNTLYGHIKGVLSLACIEEKSILLSAGYEHEIFIWDMIVGGKRVGALQGHSQSLIGVKTFPGTYQIISGDVSGIFKVWDSRTMSLVQTFSIPTNNNKKANCFCVTSVSKKRIIIGSDQLFYYDYEESREGNLADSKSCLNILYNEVFNQFVSAHIDSIKVWDASTGTLKKVFRGISDNEISCISFDQRKRKLFIGDVEGEVRLINILNGVEMKRFTSHKDYISSMSYYMEGKRFISAGWDGYVKVHDDNTADEKGQLLSILTSPSMNRRNSCNSVDLSLRLRILASGFDSGVVMLNNMSSLASEGNLFGHKKVTLVHFLNDLPALIACDYEGMIYFWTFLPLKPKKTMIEFVLENKSLNENNKKENFPVKCLCFEQESGILLTGDETGNLKGWDVNNYIKYLKLIEYDSKILKDGFYVSNEYNDNLLENFKKLIKEGKPDGPIPLKCLNEFKEKLELKPFLIKEWKGHRDGVNSLCCYSDPLFFASCGQDCSINIFDGTFKKIGSLTTNRDAEWNLKFDLEAQKKKKREIAEYYYNLVKAPSYYDNMFLETEDEVIDPEKK
jgi:WD40 repeat protein